MLPTLTSRPPLRATPAPESSTAQRADEQPSPRARFLRALVRELDESQTPWCLLRGHEGFPHLHPGGDLDLLVDPRVARSVGARVVRLAREHSISLWERRRSGFLEEFELYSCAGPGRHEFFGIDVHRAEACLGVPFLDALEVLARTRRVDGLPRPAPVLSACIDALGALLSSGAIPERHARSFREALAAQPTDMRRELARWFGAEHAAAIAAAAERGADFAARLDHRRLRRAVLARAFAAAPMRSLADLLAFGWAVRVEPWWRPRGRFFAMLGTDGSGKSTVLAGMLRELRAAFGEERVHAFHLRPGLLPQINALVHGGRTTYSLDDMALPHRATPSGTLGSLARASYYAADYVAGYVGRLLPLRRRSAIVAFDRYAHDYLVDPLRSRIRRGVPGVRALVRLCPRPERLIVCSAPLELVRARKQELSEDESRLQLALYEELARSDARAVLVSTAGSVQDAVDAALRALFETCEAATSPASTEDVA